MSLIIFDFIITFVCCFFTLIRFKSDKFAAILWLFLTFIASCCLFNSITRYMHRNEPKTHVVKNVIVYQIDSTLTISGADTTKTYILTYSK